MADLLSISVGILAILTTTVNITETLLDLIGRFQGSSETLGTACGDLVLTRDILRDLRGHISGSSAISTETALSGVLVQCQHTCEQFKKDLEGCVTKSPSTSTTAFYKLKIAMRQGRIQKFRDKLLRNRQLIGLRLQMINL